MSEAPSSRTPGLGWSLATLLVLTVALQLPIGLIRQIIRERETNQEQARTEVRAAWGGAQAIVGPMLVVPYRTTPPGRSPGGVVEQSREGEIVFAPASVDVRGSVDGEVLHRGIFGVPVYRADIEMSGRFDATDLALGEALPGDLLWSEARLVVEVSDPRSIAAESRLEWAGVEVALQPGSGSSDGEPGVHGLVGGSEPLFADFSLRLVLNGSESLFFSPVAAETSVQLSSDWQDPSFNGRWLPNSRSVSKTGFEAEWSIPYLGRTVPDSWESGSQRPNLEASLFGVDFLSSVDHYRMSERSTKYSILFLVLTFGAFWMFEVLSGLRLHPVQYLLVGAAICLFFLLELALSEHVGFLPAYVLATLAIVGLITSYCRTVLLAPGRAQTVGALLGCLYSYLYVLLRLEQYALLAGTVGLFVALAATMYLTRWIDWRAIDLGP